MTLIYLILTTKANAATRQRWQKDTWLKGVDYVYLDQPLNGEEIYTNVAHKYVAWLKANELKHDWYFFCDDDTWVNTAKLTAILRPTSNAIMTGFKGGEFTVEGTTLKTQWCSGGAGIGISRVLLKGIQQYVCGDPIISNESDTSLGIWAKMCDLGFVTIHNRLFRPQHPRHASNNGVKGCITYHYCEKQDFESLNNGEYL